MLSDLEIMLTVEDTILFYEHFNLIVEWNLRDL